MARSFRLPDLGEGVHEAEILAVHVSVGEQVREGDIILEVETDKAAVEIPSPFSGTVSEVRVQAGDTARVGDVLMVFRGSDETTEEIRPSEEAGSPAAVVQASESSHEGPVPASPATRRLARELGVELRDITPTGRGGVITAEDVRAFTESKERTETVPEPLPVSHEVKPATGRVALPAGEDLPDFARWGPVQRIPFRSLRRATARQMVTAWSLIPHVNSQNTVDITRLEDFRRKHKAAVEAGGGRLTLTVFALKAVAAALKAYPQFNASLDVASQQIILKQYYHIGVAVNTDDGLIVPVIRDVDRKSIRELAAELQECTRQTRSRKIARDQLQGGTFTITNAGAVGGGFFTPIINHPEVAILGMGQARLQPAVITGADGVRHIEPRLIMPLVLCVDHRVLDGADAIRFLQMLIHVLQDPDELLMTMT